MDSTTASTSHPIASTPPRSSPRPSAQRRSKSERLAIAEAWLASGLNAQDFAVMHGVTASSLGRWRRELARASRDDDGSFVELTLAPDAPASFAIEVVVGGGHRVRVARGFDETTLARLMRVLQGGAAS